jgi:hypothetical protein
MKIVLPFVSIPDDEPTCRYPITLREAGGCEAEHWGPCSQDDISIGDEDDNSPIFCLKHFHELHCGKNKQAHVEPMNEEELTML